jgi:Phosphotransferase enzyme family
MVLKLSTSNVIDYLIAKGFCVGSDLDSSSVEQVSARNFNLLVWLKRNDRKLFLKQERLAKENQSTALQRESILHGSLKDFPSLGFMYDLIPDVVCFDKSNSIIVHNYSDEYQDLMSFYEKETIFPVEIAESIGYVLGQIHRETFMNDPYKNKLGEDSSVSSKGSVTDFVQSLEEITPDIFGEIPYDAMKFFVLYQRYSVLHESLTELAARYKPCCLAHNDLKLNNILISNNWQHNCLVRILDWETMSWGDPAFDLGSMISSYLQMWLSSIVVNKNLSIDESLELATMPLDEIQLSIDSMVRAYLQEFPSVLQHCPDFLLKSIQFSGVAIVEQIQSMIQHRKIFDNMGIAMLQVAKSLVCSPKKSASTVFGPVLATQLFP